MRCASKLLLTIHPVTNGLEHRTTANPTVACVLPYCKLSSIQHVQRSAFATVLTNFTLPSTELRSTSTSRIGIGHTIWIQLSQSELFSAHVCRRSPPRVWSELISSTTPSRMPAPHRLPAPQLDEEDPRLPVVTSVLNDHFTTIANSYQHPCPRFTSAEVEASRGVFVELAEHPDLRSLVENKIASR